MNEYEVKRLREAKSGEGLLGICQELLDDTFQGMYPAAPWLLQDVLAQQIPEFFPRISYEELTNKVECYINEIIIPEARSMYPKGNFYYGSADFEWSYRFFQRYKLWLVKEYQRFLMNLKGNRESRPEFYVIPRTVARFFAKICDMRDFWSYSDSAEAGIQTFRLPRNVYCVYLPDFKEHFRERAIESLRADASYLKKRRNGLIYLACEKWPKEKACAPLEVAEAILNTVDRLEAENADKEWYFVTHSELQEMQRMLAEERLAYRCFYYDKNIPICEVTFRNGVKTLYVVRPRWYYTY